MNSTAAIKRLQHIFSSKENFEREFLVYSLRIENDSEVKGALEESRYSEEIKKKIKKYLAGKLFNDGIRALLKEIAEGINDKLDGAIENRNKIDYLKKNVSEFEILLNHALELTDAYPENDFDTVKIEDIEKLGNEFVLNSVQKFSILHKIFGFQTPIASEYIENMQNVFNEKGASLVQIIRDSSKSVEVFLGMPVFDSVYFTLVIYEAVFDIKKTTLALITQLKQCLEEISLRKRTVQKPELFEDLFKSKELAEKIISILIENVVISEDMVWNGFNGKDSEILALRDVLLEKRYIPKLDETHLGKVMCKRFGILKKDRMMRTKTKAYWDTIDEYRKIIPNLPSD